MTDTQRIHQKVAEIQRGMAAVLQKADRIHAALAKMVERNKPHVGLTKLHFPVCQNMVG
jgi:hypothetical protein